MAIAPEVQRFLEEDGVEHHIVRHRRAFTAQEEAAAAHVSGYEWAKTVTVLTGLGEPIMAVLPASHSIDLSRLAEAIAAGPLRLASEEELARLYESCEVGAMPPFGNLYGQDVFVEERLAEDEWITFDAGDHEHAVRMRYADFERLVRPTVAGFGFVPGAAPRA